MFTKPSFFINLEKSQSRKNRFLREAAPKYFPNLERFDAVYGKGVDINDVDLTSNAKNSLAKSTRWRKDDIGTMGALGCYLSHVNLWKKCLTTGESHCVVFEDDADVSKSNCEAIGDISTQLKFDVLLLHRNQAIQDDGKIPYSKVHKFFGTYAYIISREGAQKLLKNCFPIDEQVDAYMSNSIQRWGLQVLNTKLFSVSHHLSFGLSDVGHYEVYKNYIYCFLAIVIFAIIIKTRWL